jgi:hypothetical protein
MSQRTQSSSTSQCLRLACCAILIGLGGGCGTLSVFGDRGNAPPPAQEVSIDEKVVGRLECQNDPCVDWYKVPVESQTELTIRVEPGSGSKRTEFGISLSDQDMTILHRADAPEGGVRQIHTTLEPGDYYVSVFGIDAPSEPVSYVLNTHLGKPRAIKKPPAAKPKVVKRKRAPAPKPPRVKPKATKKLPAIFLRCAVIDTEFEDGKTVAVLIEAGTHKGAAVGQKGRLLNDKAVIGYFDIVDVYPEGSRGRISGPMKGEVNYMTTAEIFGIQ